MSDKCTVCGKPVEFDVEFSNCDHSKNIPVGHIFTCSIECTQTITDHYYKSIQRNKYAKFIQYYKIEGI